jgi:hypothetical protein
MMTVDYNISEDTRQIVIDHPSYNGGLEEVSYSDIAWYIEAEKGHLCDFDHTVIEEAVETDDETGTQYQREIVVIEGQAYSVTEKMYTESFATDFNVSHVSPHSLASVLANMNEIEGRDEEEEDMLEPETQVDVELDEEVVTEANALLVEPDAVEIEAELDELDETVETEAEDLLQEMEPQEDLRAEPDED